MMFGPISWEKMNLIRALKPLAAMLTAIHFIINRKVKTKSEVQSVKLKLQKNVENDWFLKLIEKKCRSFRCFWRN